jgi:hypothetical protein
MATSADIRSWLIATLSKIVSESEQLTMRNWATIKPFFLWMKIQNAVHAG